jgi:hypothetical protein
MSETYSTGCAGNATADTVRRAGQLRATDWLGLAAAPTFACMALLTGVGDGAQPDILCSAADHASPLSGMTAMYLLMSTFHLQPWIRLIAGSRDGTRRT